MLAGYGCLTVFVFMISFKFLDHAAIFIIYRQSRSSISMIQIIIWFYKDSLIFTYPPNIKLHLTSVTILIHTGRFFETNIDVDY
jgi:hypothetical protein